MKVLVTGNSGFIGRHVVRELNGQGWAVVGLDVRRPERPEPGEAHECVDLLDAAGVAAVFQTHRPDAVVHLAAKTSMKRDAPGGSRFAANTVGQRNLMEAIRATPEVKRALYTSTKYVFRGPPPVPHRTYSPNTSYGESKARMEEMIWEDDGGGCEWAIVRPSTIWGPGMGKHYTAFLRMVRNGRYFHLGVGTAKKHLGYVENVAWQYRRLLECPAELVHRRVFYASDYEPWAVGEWAEAFRREFGAPRIRSVPRGVAEAFGRGGDLLVKLGLRKWPLTSFRVRNLTEDDLCEVERTREVCGDPPFGKDEAVARTVAWWLSGCGTNSGETPKP